MRLRSGWLSPQATRRRRTGSSLFVPAPCRCQYTVPDCHLVRTVILRTSMNDCLGDFHPGCRRVLASFAGTVSREYRLFLWPQVSARDSSFPIVSTQGRLRCTQRANRTALQVHLLSRTPSLSTGLCGGRTKTGLHGNRVVTIMPLMAARKP